MSDHRPQYGEIATLEEQRRAAGLPPLDEVQAPDSEVAPRPVTEDAADAPAKSSPVDRFVTIALLAYGLVNVITTGLAYLDFSSAMNDAMSMLGIDGEFTNHAQGKLWGTIAAVVLALGWSLTAFFSVRRLRRRKLAWWIPIVGAAATLLVTSICASVPMMGDPAFIEFLSASTGR